MMRCEFEKLIGHEITYEEYEKVETVYMAWDYKDMSKEKIAELYKNDRELVIDILYNYIVKHGKENDRLIRENDRLHRENDTSHRSNDGLKERNNYLEAQLHDAYKETGIMTSAALKLTEELKMYKARNEELEIQLHQYKALFADIEQNMTVSLYETLLGVAE